MKVLCAPKGGGVAGAASLPACACCFASSGGALPLPSADGSPPSILKKL
jgi:hypothetical protein